MNSLRYYFRLFLSLFVVSVFGPFENWKPVAAFLRTVERLAGFHYDLVVMCRRFLGFRNVLKPGDTAVQVGFTCERKRHSDIFTIARRVGKGGTVVAIEPEPETVEELKKIMAAGEYQCRFIPVNKAAFSQKGTTRLLIGKAKHSGIIDAMPGSENWWEVQTEQEKEITVETDTVDAMLAEAGVDPSEIAFVNLTVNGAEYEALKGMRETLEKSRDMSIAAVAGREKEGYGEGGIGWIDGEPDHVAISRLLGEYGFRTQLRRLGPGIYGQVVGTKGNQKEFM